MKILLLAHEINTASGEGRNAVTISKSLEVAGHEVTILGFKGRFWHFVKEARAHAKVSDIVHAIDMNPLGFAGYLATRFTGAKFIIITQAAYAVAPLHNRKTALLSKMIYRAADAVVAGSGFTAREIQKKVPGLPIVIIDPGIDLSKFPSSSGAHTPDASPFMMGVGAIKDRKGYEISVRAFALLKKDIPHLRYVIVGSQTDSPGYFRMLVDLAHELGVEKDVDFLTNTPDDVLNDLYEHASLFILTSVNIGTHFEGFGMVFLEAAAHGLPSISTLGNGIEDAIEDGKTGILVPQRDPEATAAAARRILTDHALAERMSIRARAFAREHDRSSITAKYERLYNDVMKA